jgi:hypothetical protein
MRQVDFRFHRKRNAAEAVRSRGGVTALDRPYCCAVFFSSSITRA